MYTRLIGGDQKIITPRGTAIHRVHLLGPHPILLHFLERMDFSRIVCSCLGTPHNRIMDHAQTLAVLIQNIILSPSPLYRIAEWARPIDPSSLGLTASEKESLNDDRIARSLDALTAPRARNLFFRLALHIIKQFELDTQRIHHDTTTVTFSGQYRSSNRITHGMNKDHRPDLKQLVFGLNITEDGAVPISHEIYNGNRSDDSIHCGNVDDLRQILHRMDFVYVADSKLCTRKNLAHVAEYGGKFVTVMPRTRAEDKIFRQNLREGIKVRWRKLLEQENKRRKSDPPDTYYTTAAGPQKTSEGYRIIWLRSSQKMHIDALARQTSLKKAEVELVDLNVRLNRGKLRQKRNIRKAVMTILRRYDVERFLNVRILFRTHEQAKRLRPGRPRKGDPVVKARHRLYYLEVKQNREALHSEAKTDGVFPLVSNLSPGRASKKDVLLIYKYQPYVEKRHALFKSELEVAPVYIKKTSRAVGLVHAAFLAMTLDALIERTLRQSMMRNAIDELPILPEGRLTKTPTTARVLEMFSNVSWYEFERGEETVTFPVKLSPLQKQLLRLLGIDLNVYTG